MIIVQVVYRDLVLTNMAALLYRSKHFVFFSEKFVTFQILDNLKILSDIYVLEQAW